MLKRISTLPINQFTRGYSNPKHDRTFDHVLEAFRSAMSNSIGRVFGPFDDSIGILLVPSGAIGAFVGTGVGFVFGGQTAFKATKFIEKTFEDPEFANSPNWKLACQGVTNGVTNITCIGLGTAAGFHAGALVGLSSPLLITAYAINKAFNFGYSLIQD